MQLRSNGFMYKYMYVHVHVHVQRILTTYSCMITGSPKVSTSRCVVILILLTTCIVAVTVLQNPDGSLSQAAMMQSALQKERREMKQQQRESEEASVPEGLGKSWVDPLPAEGRQLASAAKTIGQGAQDMPEWKKYAMGGTRASFGKKETRSILEQRQGLPIYKLKDELNKVRV